MGVTADNMGVVVHPKTAIGQERYWSVPGSQVLSVFRHQEVQAFEEKAFDIVNDA